MATKADVRKIALALDGVSAVDHFGRPSYRTKKRIFAVMRPDGLFVHLPDERKEFLFEADPKTFVKFMWGRRANVIVQIERIGKPELERLIREAWEFSRPAAAKAAGRPSSTRRPAAPRRKRTGT
ncbi:MAG TPA: MmcQ/YjbR family DNA-binding protein [Rhizomicrobium sp.]|nr:MmcQ/YjbR family DNA-binding protein [Rhizomicrobium sp.]